MGPLMMQEPSGRPHDDWTIEWSYPGRKKLNYQFLWVLAVSAQVGCGRFWLLGGLLVSWMLELRNVGMFLLRGLWGPSCLQQEYLKEPSEHSFLLDTLTSSSFISWERCCYQLPSTSCRCGCKTSRASAEGSLEWWMHLGGICKRNKNTRNLTIQNLS